MSEAVFDTSILIDYLRGVSSSAPLLEKVKSGAILGYVSVLTVAEIFAGKDAENPAKREILGELLDLFSKIEVSEDVAKTAGDLRRRHGITIVDAIIAATAAGLRCGLLTQNIKDFGKVKEIAVEKPY
jgi:predicted nucleic acid-binding protein